MSGQDIALLLHLLLFAYWLGGDIGVFYSSGFAINPKLSRGARQAAGTIMMNLDLIPRLCLSLMLTVGGILTHYYGIEHPLWQMIGIILLGPIWTFALIYIHFNEGTDLVKKMTKIDYYFRWIMWRFTSNDRMGCCNNDRFMDYGSCNGRTSIHMDSNAHLGIDTALQR